MDKQTAIAKVNEKVGYRLLTGRNTSFANVNASKAVWWLNIDPLKFKSELHLLLADDSKDRLTWLKIDANSIPAPDKVFRIRGDNGAIDLGISCLPANYMVDVYSGAHKYNFSEHIEHSWQFSEEGTTPEGVIHTIDVEQETDGRWIAEVPEIPGVLVYASTTEEAVAKVQALALRVLAERLEHGEITPGLVSVSFKAA